MTSTTDTAGHPEVEEISDLSEGLLAPARASEVRHHLDGCDLCGDVLASLEEIRGLLGTLPGPTRMPADVAERIDAALAAEALLTASAPMAEPDSGATAAHVSRETSISGTPADTNSPAPTAAPATTPAPGGPSSRPVGRPRGATGPGRTRNSRRGRRRTVTLGAVFTAAALGLGTLLVQSLGGNGSNGAHKPTHQVSESALAFSEGKLQGQVADLLGKGSASAESNSGQPSFDLRSSPRTPRNMPLRETGTATSVPDCVQRGIGRTEAPLAAEQGTYNGTRAYLVVLPHTSDVTRVSAYVVDASCAGKPSSPPGKVLLKQSYKRQ
ncbi:anti-sigma factor family protein [Streptomyces sp. NPDC002004]